MRQRLTIDGLYGASLRRLSAGAPGESFPAENPFSLDEVLTEHGDVLVSRLPPRLPAGA